MNLLVVGGFLGSGKTTVILSLIRSMQKYSPGLIAVIENEIGDVGVDGAVLDSEVGEADGKGGGVVVKPLFGGCVCCEIRIGLLDAIDEIGSTLSPEWIIVEMTGLAVMTSITNSLKDHAQSPESIYSLSVVDLSRWELLSSKLDYFTRSQLSGCDAIICNKADLLPPEDVESASVAVREFSGVGDVFIMSSSSDRDAVCLELLRHFSSLAPEVCSSCGESHVCHGHDHEHEHDHDHDHELEAGALTAVYDFPGGLSGDELERAVDTVSRVFRGLGRALSRNGLVSGHIKGILTLSGDDLIYFSATRPGEADITRRLSEPEGCCTTPRLTINIIMARYSSKTLHSIAAPYLKRIEGVGAVGVRDISIDHALDAGER